MDQRIFDQLDQLERGARSGTRPSRDVYNDSSAKYSAYDDPQVAYYDDGLPFQEGLGYGEGEFLDQPMALDSFDEHLLRQPDFNSRHGQAALGQARLSLPTGNLATARGPRELFDYGPPMSQALQEPSEPRRLDLSPFALDNGPDGQFSSSPLNRPQPSSPAFNASQRRPTPIDFPKYSRPANHDRFSANLKNRSAYEPLSIEQLEAEGRGLQLQPPETFEQFQPDFTATPRVPTPKRDNTTPPVVQGISLISTQSLPDRFRSIFSYPLFNAVQSKSFETIYKTNDNFVLSAPTGSGKTAVLELAICRLVNGYASGSFKIVYQAPTKSLCSERQRDWQAKFAPLDLKCAELTGDTDYAQLRNVQHASIIITTPEKWDSVTRKWKDHQKLMQMVKLFLIDEVHILKEDRGATLEAVVSRMKSVGSDVRFVALSATVPNSDDIATWLGKDPTQAHIPAPRERFGEEFRPVRLQKHVCGYPSTSNDFAFEKTLNAKLPEVISKWSQRKPIMVFCFTRNACVETAKLLANWWATKGPRERFWSSPRKRIVVTEKDLRDTISSGVAFHHAGLSIQDRSAIEKGYLDGDINVICCTSTLAVGVNLPCHMVIIKGTVTYQSNAAGGCKEYSNLEIMQMLGRAGRPQFDDSAIAIIITRMQRVQYYEKMITGQEILESCLHRNLIDHLNAEIGLGTVSSASSARKWLSGTFLYVRLKENPEHYKLDGDAPGRNFDERLECICSKGIAMLEENDLVQATPKLHCTEFGDAMARYYLQFETMRIFLALPPKSKVSEILSAISQAAEFRDVRFRAGEKNTYKELNKNSSIKFPIPVNLDAPAHKVSLVIQSVLGAVDLPTGDHKQRIEYTSAKAVIFQHVHRLVRCIIDCQLYLEDAVTTRNALMLARSLGAQVWDDSPLHLKQLDGVGLVSVRKLASIGIKSIEDLETTEAHRIEQALSRNPPFGTQIQDKAKAFPKLRVAVKVVGEPFIKKGVHVTIKIRAEIGFVNERVPEVFQRKPVYVCLLAETSDGHKVHFARTSAKKLSKGQDVHFSANLTAAEQSIRTYVMCDEIAGTLKYAILKPEISPSAFPKPKSEAMQERRESEPNVPNTSKRRASGSKAKVTGGIDSDEFGDDDLNDADLARAEAGGFVDIDDFADVNNGGGQPKKKKRKTSVATVPNEEWGPQQLPNGNWACKHTCNDKTACKHLCCRDGLEKKPKPPKPKESKRIADPGSDPKQTQLNMSTTKKNSMPPPPTNPVHKASTKTQRNTDESREARDLNRLHNSIKTKTRNIPVLGQGRMSSTAPHLQAKGDKPRLGFLEAARGVEEDEGSTDYDVGSFDLNDFPNLDDVAGAQPAARMSPPREYEGADFANEDMFDVMDADFGYDQPLAGGNADGHVDFSSYADENSLEQLTNWDFDDLEEDESGGQRPNRPQEAARSNGGTSKKHDNLFVGYSTDSAAEDLDLKPTQFQRAPVDKDTSSRIFFATQETQTQPSTPSAEEAEYLSRVLPADDFLMSVVDNVETQPELEDGGHASDPDELEKWFKAEFGTEQFNYIG